MKCNRCGKELKPDHIYCPSCGNQIEKENKKAIIIAASSIISTILSVITFFFLRGNNISRTLSSGLFLLGLVLIIFAKIRYPKSKTVTILFIIELFLIGLIIILMILTIILVMVFCNSVIDMIQSCPG